MNKNQKRNLVYSTNPDWKPERVQKDKTLIPGSGTAYISLERKGRRGKHVTVIKGLAGNLKPLLKELQKICGSGGTVKEEIIEIQGDKRQQVANYLQSKGFKAKQSGG